MSDLPQLRVLPSSPCELDFSWYELIREELLRRMVPEGARVLDIGCGGGAVLRGLSGQIESGIGVDISPDAIARAAELTRSEGVDGLEFLEANALDLPFPDARFDVALCLGDVLSSSTIFGRDERAVGEISRVLRDDGVAVYEGMNWQWEYAQSPRWTWFSREGDGSFALHRTRRTAAGRETDRAYDVKSATPLHAWLLQQEWPVSPRGDRTSLDIEEAERIPAKWLAFSGMSKHRFYTARSIRRLYRKEGFTPVNVLPYGMTHDVAARAGLMDALAGSVRQLAEAEADLMLERRTGAGPWLFLTARKEGAER